MKKIIIFLLFIISFINVNDVVFASSQKEAAYHGMRKGFGFLVKTRDESALNPETIQKRRRVEGMIINTYSNSRQELRDMLIQAYNEEVEGFKNNYNEHKKNKDGKEHLSLECLGELRRIKALMISGKK